MNTLRARYALNELRNKPDEFWDNLFAEYLRQDLPRKEFLRSKGIPPRDKLIEEKTRDWAGQLSDGHYRLHCARKLVNLGPRREVAQILELVRSWKNDLSVKHYKAAQLALIHAELILTRELILDKDGNPIKSKITPTTLRALTSVIAEVQKVQRMALGLPGETTGVITADVTTQQRAETVFTVAINQNGKFVNARPQQENPDDYNNLAAMDTQAIVDSTSEPTDPT